MLTSLGKLTLDGYKDLDKFFRDSINTGTRQYGIPLSRSGKRHTISVLKSAVNIGELLDGSDLNAALAISEESYDKLGLVKVADSILFQTGFFVDGLDIDPDIYRTKGKRYYFRASEAYAADGKTKKVQAYRELSEFFGYVAMVFEDIRVRAEVMHALNSIKLDSSSLKDSSLLLMDPYIMDLAYQYQTKGNRIAARVLQELGVPLHSVFLDAKVH